MRSVTAQEAPHTRCSVKRVKTDSGEILFHMQKEGGEHLLTARGICRKDGSMRFSQFKQDSQHCIAELRPGKEKDEFNLWFNRDGLVDGQSQQNICSIAHDAIRDTPLYSMRVSLPDRETSERMGIVVSPEHFADRAIRHAAHEKQDLFPHTVNKPSTLRLRTKVPEWNEEMQSYTLDYNGRARLASAKNFQLELAPATSAEAAEIQKAYDTVRGESRRDRRRSRRAIALAGVKLQFGKYDDDTFNLDYAHPLCGIQALAIALTTSSWT